MTWAAKRQLQYLSGFLAIILVIVLIIIAPYLRSDPTCFDGKQNGNEEGIDCGGSCDLICQGQAIEPVIIWSRAFSVIGNNHNLIAFIENRNKDKAVYKVNYEFRVYNRDNRLIGRREGSTFIPPNQKFAIVEPRFNSGLEEVKSTTFTFTSPLVWYKKEPTLQTVPFKIQDLYFEGDINGASLSLRVQNDSIYELPAFDVIAILYDKEGNAINGSISKREPLKAGSSMSVVFTWPEALSTVPVTNDVFLSINPFNVSF